MSRIRLDSISSLIFYKDTVTASRRAPAVQQLKCLGEPCRLYRPDVVRCVSLGGSDTDVSWKCEADLPEALRFGAVEVLCEGWDGPSDPYILKGSCGLEYRLVQIPDALRRPGADDPAYRGRLSSWLHDPAAAFFMLLWVAVLAFILYNFLSSYFRPRAPAPLGGGASRRPWWGPGSGPGWFPSTRPDDFDPFAHDPPPPYTTTTKGGRWRPGFWSGAALGGLGAFLANRRPARPRAPTSMYDWEGERAFRQTRPVPAPVGSSAGSWGAGASARRRGGRDEGDRGEGPSNLGGMRSGTGIGSSRVR
ncbi:Store-operated calcium entry-associated regulatory factor [Trametes pubescens]|uniref:Store-operated calcium entry-associated regulatory factor n=1 Tax=Trametes pubescens TaxID=154538 RepID=A0A1M2W225_TRAPU|nr:Store-operated calcium entry-associated regulatory factor [Trametes pubescens]